jgi:hypothetical protein
VLVVLSFLFAAGADMRAANAGSYDFCPATGSPFGPFDLLTYEHGDYKSVYGRAMELAGYNQLFPDIPSFALPQLYTGARGAGTGQPASPSIPPVILKSIGWIESNWAQGDYSVPYGSIGQVLTSPDCGYGIMQVTSGMQNVSGVPSLEQAMIGGNFAFNIARGAQILAGKWNVAPDYRPIVGDRDPGLIENWYYALWGYNGFVFKNHPLNPDYQASRVPFSCGPDGDSLGHDRSQYPYQELVLGCAAHPPVRGDAAVWTPQEAHLPDLNDPAFAQPLQLGNWAPCSYDLNCAAMDMPTPNTSHRDPTAPAADRAQVIGAPVLGLSRTQLTIPWESGQNGIASVTVSNSGTGVLAWTATSSAPWLWVSRNEGVALGSDLGGIASTLSLAIDSSSVPAGGATASVTLQSLYAAGAPTTIQVTATPVAPTSPAPGFRIWGDIDCSNLATVGDAQKLARSLVGLAGGADASCPLPGAPITLNGAPAIWGDVDCAGSMAIADAQKIARALIGLPTNQAQGCPAIGDIAQVSP